MMLNASDSERVTFSIFFVFVWQPEAGTALACSLSGSGHGASGIITAQRLLVLLVVLLK